jgi:hypothetical protein
MMTMTTAFAAAAAIAAAQPTPSTTGWTSGATPSTSRDWQPRQDLPLVGPPPLWVQLPPELLARPITPRRGYDAAIGHHLVIPRTATPYIATRLLHEADRLGVAVWDQRFPTDEDHPAVVYATRPRGWEVPGAR